MSACRKADALQLALGRKMRDVHGIAWKMARYNPGDPGVDGLVPLLEQAKQAASEQKSIIVDHESSCATCGGVA